MPITGRVKPSGAALTQVMSKLYCLSARDIEQTLKKKRRSFSMTCTEKQKKHWKRKSGTRATGCALQVGRN
jgi:hypothetical protein